MLFMVIEHFEPGAAAAIYRRAAESGRVLPPGVEYVDSWVAEDLTRCFQLMRADSATALEPWMAAWSDLARFELVPVIGSAVAQARALGGAVDG
ncbi:MAG: DUF3303 domain-containing protein [Gammaproteobacteria bacterium]